MPHLIQIQTNKVEKGKISSSNSQIYDINKEMMSLEHEIEAKKAEVPQEYIKWEVTEKEVEVMNEETGKMEKKIILHADYISPDAPQIPIPDPRNTHLAPYDKLSKFWSNFLMEKHAIFTKNKYIFLKHDEVREVLKHVFNAKEEDLNEFQHAHDNMNQDPTMDCRKHASYRLGLNFNSGIAQRLVREPLITHAKDGIVEPEKTGRHRFFGDVQDWVMQNSALQALVRLKASFIYGNLNIPPREGLDAKRNFNQMAHFMRIISTPKILGDPTSEGVHQDGGDFTMTVLLKSQNVDFDGGSGLVSLVNLNEPFGTKHDEKDPKNVIETLQPREYLDTLIFVDTALSHVVTPINALEKSKPAHRDIFATTTRHMAKIDDKNSSYALLDKEIAHKTLPCAFALQSKELISMQNSN